MLDASAVGVAQSKKDPVVGKALVATPSKEQMMFWMQELSEILILDHIFSQQDRPGNIDYTWDWYYVDEAAELKSVRTNSKVSRSAMNTIQPPEEVKQSGRHFLIQKTQLNDNDAGGRRYVNFTQKFGLLTKLRHLNPVTYRQIVRLAKDFEAKGPLYRYLHDAFYISDSNVELIRQNAIQAAQILQSTCKAEMMKFDLTPEAYLVKQQIEQAQVDCDNP